MTDAPFLSAKTGEHAKQGMGDCLYGRNVEDLDGHVIELMWLDVAAMMRAGAAASTEAA